MRVLEVEGGSTKSHSVENLLWKRLWTCHKAGYERMCTLPQDIKERGINKFLTTSALLVEWTEMISSTSCKLDSKMGTQDVETIHNKIHHIYKMPRNRTHLQNKS